MNRTRRISESARPMSYVTLKPNDEWTLQSGFDGDELLSQPDITMITVAVDVIRQAEALIESCEQCNPDEEIPFDNMLDRVTGSDPSITDYILEQPAKCPNCKWDIFEKTLVEPV
jgi:hypothetical protein